jgi:hypothetical protein
MELVHKPWTTPGLGPRWIVAVRPRAQRRAHWSTTRRRYGSPVVAARGGGGRGARGGAKADLTRDGAAVKRSGNGNEGTWWGRAPT